MRDQTGGYDASVRKAGEPAPEHYCTCRHLKLQHGQTDYPRSHPGCWWCACTTEHTDYRAAVEQRRAS